MIDNGAIFDPESKSLVVSARASDIQVFTGEDGRITEAVAHLDGGIEIVHSADRLWWPL